MSKRTIPSWRSIRALTWPRCFRPRGFSARDRALLQQARIDLNRYRKAWKKNAIQKQLLDDQEQIAIQDEGTVKADEGAVEAAKANLSYCHITSPIDGRAGLRLVDPGNMIQSNSTTPLVVVAQIKPITVVFSVAEDFIAQIQEELRRGGSMRVDAYDRAWTRQIASGAFLSLDNQIDTTTGTVKIKAVFDNTDEALFPNQFVNAKLLVNTQKGATVIAANAVQRGAQGTFVYVIKPDQTAQIRVVKLGPVNGEIAAVQGVEAGEQIAVNGFDKLKDGAKVSITSPSQLAGSAAKTGVVP